MARKPTRKALNAKVEALLDMAHIAQRYKELEKDVKAGMKELGLVGDENGIEIEGKGRVFISEGSRVTIPPDAVIAELGELLAAKILKRSVIKSKFDSFCEADIIDEKQQTNILDQSTTTPVVSLYVRPLK